MGASFRLTVSIRSSQADLWSALARIHRALAFPIFPPFELPRLVSLHCSTADPESQVDIFAVSAVRLPLELSSRLPMLSRKRRRDSFEVANEQLLLFPARILNRGY